MDNIHNHHHSPLHTIGKTLGIGLVGILALVAVAIAAVILALRSCKAGIDHDGRTTISPTQITKIQSIGQWEFLAVSDEELVDTIRHGFFGDDELSRIYYGTLRLGIDLHDTGDDWITMDHDTVAVILPPIKLLDDNFIDEARTKAFYEEGKWSEADKARLTRKAAQVMRRRCLTPANIGSAERNAIAQFDNLLRSMGFEFTRIRFQK